MPETKRHTADERRQELILATYDVIAEKGFEGLRVREVAAKAGVNIATLHYYFPSKEDLIRGVVDYIHTQFITITAPTETGEDPAPGELGHLVRDLAVQLERKPELFLVLSELHLRSPRNPAIQELLLDMDTSWRAHVRQLCAEGVRAGALRQDLDPDRAASILTALVKGLGLQHVSRLNTPDYEAIGHDIEDWLKK
jgi:AcrR family transcriptional regulator